MIDKVKDKIISHVDAFPKARFLSFCLQLKILSKDYGLVSFKLLGTQAYVLDEMCKALDKGISTFVILKARQLGMSTFFLALDLFWAFEHAGLSGALATHTEALRDQFRAMIEIYLAHLPKGYKVGYSRHNRTLLILKNTSMFSYLVAGTKETNKNGLGRGGAYNMAHCSEVAFWGQADDIANLRSALSTHYAHRLQIFESTANGFNHFADMCEAATNSPSQKFIFVGWWRNELYRYEKDHPYFEMYWDGRLSVMEKKRVAAVKKEYNVDIQPEQIAWVRWKLNDEFGGDQSAFDQEFPWLATDAFVATGSKFFSNESLTDAMRMAHRVAFKPYRYVLSQNWSDTGVVNVKDARAELRVWQEAEPNGYYSIGCDPAYGSSDKNDRTVICVLRCYADRAVQVAEYCSPSISTYQCAWVLAHLAGYYRNCKVNLEITGPGSAVFDNLLTLQREVAKIGSKTDESTEIRNCLGNMQHYVYRRPDSMGGGMAYQWRTTRETKTVAMNTFKDMVELRRCTMLSLPALEEMKSITVDDGVIEASGSGKDDRVMAAALACIAWRQQVQQKMAAEGLTYTEVHNREDKGPVPKIQKRVLDYLKSSQIRIG